MGGSSPAWGTAHVSPIAQPVATQTAHISITQIPHQILMQLLATFGATRDAMMEKDLQGWIDANRIYPGIAETVRDLIDRHEFYVVTTKQARFAEAILRQLAKVDLPPERIFSQAESGAPKSEILELLEQRHPGAAYTFVEDKALTLHKVMECGWCCCFWS